MARVATADRTARPAGSGRTIAACLAGAGLFTYLADRCIAVNASPVIVWWAVGMVCVSVSLAAVHTRWFWRKLGEIR